MSLVRVPKRFITDHDERALPTPTIHKATTRHFWIDSADPHFLGLLSDAEYYASDAQDHDFGARALICAIDQQLGWCCTCLTVNGPADTRCVNCNKRRP